MEHYARTRGGGTVGATPKAGRLAALRELEMLWLEIPALAPGDARTLARRRQELAVLEFPSKLERLRAWVSQSAEPPQEAWTALLSDLVQTIADAVGAPTRDRVETTLVEGKK